MDRRWASVMLSMYDELHADAPAHCVDLAAADRAGAAPASDFLAAPSVEQFRARVGRLRRVPFVKHPPEQLPTMDSYYARAAGGGGGWTRCFPRVYARGCVPAANQSAVDAMSCA